MNPHSIQKMIHWCSIIIIMFAVPCDSKSSNETMMMNHIQSVLFKQMILHKKFRLIFFIYWTLNAGYSGIENRAGIRYISWGFFGKSFTFCHLFPEHFSRHVVFCEFGSKVKSVIIFEQCIIFIFGVKAIGFACGWLIIFPILQKQFKGFFTLINNDSTHSKWWWHH